MAKHINGTSIAHEIKSNLACKVLDLKKKNIIPSLAVIMVGDDPASKIYVRKKSQACQEVGINSITKYLPEDTSQDELGNIIDELNFDKTINGILVQLPLPKHISEEYILEKISPNKDVDSLSPINMGKIMIGNYNFAPCTPAGIIEMLNHENIEIKSKHCVVIGRSNIVGKPTAMLLLHNGGTVTVCHSGTKNLSAITREADILVSAVGKAGFVTSNMIKNGAVVIDVGTNRKSNGKVCGDVCFDEVEKIASHITPVPGGVGPMTIAMLMKNTIKATILYNTK
jgi:methylenetetrahydrofolate dehydrogenase (NADP+)/methenyltetrahydrofolate cyclohydrolase